MEIEQVIKIVTGFNAWKLSQSIQEKTTEFNEKGYELTAISTNGSNSTSSSCFAILVFTKKL